MLLTDSYKLPTTNENQRSNFTFKATSELLFSKATVIWNENDVRIMLPFIGVVYCSVYRNHNYLRIFNKHDNVKT